MIVPKYIKEAITKAGRHNKIATVNNEKVRKWLIENRLYNDSILDQLIDSCEQGVDASPTFIEYLETEELDIGNEYGVEEY